MKKGFIIVITAFILAGILVTIFSRSDKELSQTTGNKNEDSNDKLLASCKDLDDLWNIVINTQVYFLTRKAQEATKDKPAVEEKWLVSDAAVSYFKEINEKFKSTDAYNNFIAYLKDQGKELDSNEIYKIFGNSSILEGFHLSKLSNDLTSKIIEQINSRESLNLKELNLLNFISKMIIDSVGNLDNHPRVKDLDVALQENNERYINYFIEQDMKYLVEAYSEHSDKDLKFTQLLYEKIVNIITNEPQKLTTEVLMQWVISSPMNKTIIEAIFNDDKYNNYPHKEILIHFMNNDYDGGIMYSILKTTQNKTVYDKVLSLFHTNILIGLALTQNIYSQDENYEEYFDNLMTEGWNTLYMLQLLDDNKKFIQDMGNDKKRDLKARIEDLEHKNMLLSEAEKASKAAEEQVQAAQNAEKFAQQQAGYQQQQAEYQRIQAEQAAIQTQYQEQSARNTAATKKAVENGVVKKRSVLGQMGNQFSRDMDMSTSFNSYC